ncbi:hypothetical protein T265_05154 [Opisthorchis viverrini]|uniref:POU domain protein n=1 Tax=Opisthorchis viverrini TaxID=6198 RepID=A0A074ZPX5_OPIVI|nr:hypothetical protein T265_05154 [Opisthorchis viverrini]KER27867.1 hypothetical protein T265_05154 [Opisthorchis viverrini]
MNSMPSYSSIHDTEISSPHIFRQGAFPIFPSQLTEPRVYQIVHPDGAVECTFHSTTAENYFRSDTDISTHLLRKVIPNPSSTEPHNPCSEWCSYSAAEGPHCREMFSQISYSPHAFCPPQSDSFSSSSANCHKVSSPSCSKEGYASDKPWGGKPIPCVPNSVHMITPNSLPYRAEAAEACHSQYSYYTDSPGVGPSTSDFNDLQTETLRFGPFSSLNLSAESSYFANSEKRPNNEESISYLAGIKSTDLPKYTTRLPEQSKSVLIKEQQCLQKDEGQCPVLMEWHGKALHTEQPKINFGNNFDLNRHEVDSHNAEVSTTYWSEAVAKHGSKVTCAQNSAQAYDNLRRSFGFLSAFTQLLMPSSEHPTSKVSSRCESPSFTIPNDKRTGPSESCIDLLSQNLNRYLCDTLLTRQCETALNDSITHTNRSLTPDQVTATVYSGAHEIDELRAFANKFKQRRMKLGITQAEVGRALGCLQIGGFGCLSQSTICRFESLTLSHNNMLVLKPILEEWLDIVEREHEERRLTRTIGQDDIVESEYYSEEMRFYGTDRRRRRTSITDPEKHLLEAYFLTQPKPSTDELALIADRIKLRKNVVRVWFCNQRQKQKRLHTKQMMCDTTNQRHINRQ